MKSKGIKDERLLKHMFIPVIYFILSFALAGILLASSYKVLYWYYEVYYFDRNIIIKLINILIRLKNNTLGEYFYIVVLLVIWSSIYIRFMYKRTRNLVNILETTEIMASGDLNKVIEVNSKDDISELGININSIVTQLRNITEEERKAQQTKTDLITNVSHDLRTPLTSIMGYLGLIEEDKYKDEVELRYYINIAYEKSKSLNVLINDLFELTKVQNNSIKLDKVEINLVELISQIMYQFNYSLKKEGMEYRLDFSEDKLIIQADPSKLVRALENLITNAMRYGKEGHYVDVITKKESNYAVIQIINYGEPIPILDLPHIFDRFYRVEKSRNRNDGGSGLGLAITKNIIEIHDGKIAVSSDNNRTVFEIKLPLIDKI